MQIVSSYLSEITFDLYFTLLLSRISFCIDSLKSRTTIFEDIFMIKIGVNHGEEEREGVTNHRQN